MDHARDTVPRGDEIARDRAPVQAGGHAAGSAGVGSAIGTATATLPVLAVVPPTASDLLRTARVGLGLTASDIAAKTRITVRYIEALDRGNFAALPGRPYVLGFVRTYARAVGLDGTELVGLARAEMDAGTPRPAPRIVHQYDVDDPAKTPSRTVTWVAFAMVIAVLATGGLFWRSYYAPGATLPSLIQPVPAPRGAAPVPQPAPVAAVALGGPSGGPVVFTARENGIWVKFYDGHGTQLLQKQLALGESYTVPADAFEPRLWTGRPDALAVTIGGQPVAPLSDRRAIMRDVPVTPQALAARPRPAAPGMPSLPVPSLPGIANGATPRVRAADGSRHPVRHRSSASVAGGDEVPVPGPAPSPGPAPAPSPVPAPPSPTASAPTSHIAPVAPPQAQSATHAD